MSRMIQIRNVPDELHREAKVRAARAGMSLSEFLLREIERALSYPPVEDLLARIESRPRPQLSETPAEAVRAERDAR
ncbi:MAG: FitA-like ribbon-helix-helix domain-containing protein [Acidimicrobiia bacterium]